MKNDNELKYFIKQNCPEFMLLDTENMEFDNDDDRHNYLVLKYRVIMSFLNKIIDGDDRKTQLIFYKGLINELELRLQILKQNNN